jgi:hypothetical protein
MRDHGPLVEGSARGPDGPVDVLCVTLGHVARLSPVAGFGVSKVRPEAASPTHRR